MPISEEAQTVIRDLNPWWEKPGFVRPHPPSYRRRSISEIRDRLLAGRKLIEVLRGPRQVGKTTGIHQIIQDLMKEKENPANILFVRFDLEILRETPGSLRNILRWFAKEIRRKDFGVGKPPFVFLDEIHKLRKWSEEVKHIADTFPLHLVLTGSSSVLVAKGGRESLAGRVFSTEIPPFSFREVIEAWKPKLARALPAPIRFNDSFDSELSRISKEINDLRPQQKLALRRSLEKYYNRGGYPRLHSGEVDDDRWADYLVQTIFENVLGSDIPDLFPVQDPQLLRHLYLSIARLSGNEISQPLLTKDASVVGIKTTQPTVGRYLHYLSDALLIREFRRYPMAKRRSARVPAKLMLTDLGVRNAIFRGAPSLWESEPAILGPLVETLAQTVIRDRNLQVHFWRDYSVAGNRRSKIVEVDFIAERVDGSVLPIEIKFRSKIDPEDSLGVRMFRKRYPKNCPTGIVVTRNFFHQDEKNGILFLPLLYFLLSY